MKPETLQRKREKFRTDFQSRFGNEWNLVTEFNGYNQPVTVRHIPCGTVISLPAAKVSKKNSDLYCAACGKKDRLQRKASEYQDRFFAELGEEWELLTTFNGSHEPITAIHIPCGEARTAPARDFFRRGCVKCQYAKGRRSRVKDSADEYIREITEKYEVSALSEYEAMRKPMLWKCNHCGSILEKTVENILWRKGEYGGGLVCDCKLNRYDSYLSDGTWRIIKYLREKEIPYRREVRYDTCRLEHPLPFDFVVYSSGGTPLCAIEHNGQQHYMPIEHLGGEDGFIRRQKADKIKADWCKENGLPLLTIRFDAKIENELETFLNSL